MKLVAKRIKFLTFGAFSAFVLLANAALPPAAIAGGGPVIELSVSGPATAQVGQATTGYATRLTNDGNAAIDENVIVRFVISGPSALEAGDVVSEYELTPGSGTFAPLTLVVCGDNLCGDFGPSTGFPVAANYDATTATRNTFAQYGAHSVNARVIGVDTQTEYASDTFSGTVLGPDLTLDLVGPATVDLGEATVGFSATIVNIGNGATLENVNVRFEISGPEALQAGDVVSEYESTPGSGTYLPLPLTVCGNNLCGVFGPSTGFPVDADYDSTTALRNTFNVSGAHSVVARVVGVDTDTVFATDTLASTVRDAELSLELDGPASVDRGVATTGFSATLQNNGDAPKLENVIVRFVISGPGSLAAGDVVSEYETSPGNFAPIPLSVCGANLCGDFGPVDGFPVSIDYDVTTALRSTFNVTGTYTVQASVVGVDTQTVFDIATLSTTAESAPAVLVKVAGDSQAAAVGTAVAIAPQVRVEDAGGGPVQGAIVTFTVTSGGGSVSSASVLSDEDGLASVASWTLGQMPGTNTLGADISGTKGLGVEFTATATAQSDISVSVVSTAEYVRSGSSHTHVVVVTNNGPSPASNVSIDVPLPPEHEPSTATWICQALGGAQCDANGLGPISDALDLPVGASVVFVTSADVLPGPNDFATITATVLDKSDAAPLNDTDSATTTIVVFRNSFEVGGNGAVNGSDDAIEQTLAADDIIEIDLTTVAATQVALVTRGVTADGQQFEIVLVRAGTERVVLLATTDVEGRTTTASAQLTPSTLKLALGLLSDGGRVGRLMVVGEGLALELPVGATSTFVISTAP